MLDGKTIRIGALVYTIQVVEKPCDEDTHLELYGDINYSKLTIRIDQSLSTALQRITLWHEVLHGLIHHAGHEHDEMLIQMISHGLAQVFMDNPWIADVVAVAATEKEVV